jgi:hypothetical protein
MHDGMAKAISSIGLAAWPDVEDPGLLNIFLLLPDSTIMKRQSNCHTIAKKKRKPSAAHHQSVNHHSLLLDARIGKPLRTEA